MMERIYKGEDLKNTYPLIAYILNTRYPNGFKISELKATEKWIIKFLPKE